MFAEEVAAEMCCYLLLLIIYGVRLLLRSAFVFKSACRQHPFCSDMLSCDKYFCVLFWCLKEFQGAYEQTKLKTEITCSRLFFEEHCRIVSDIHHHPHSCNSLHRVEPLPGAEDTKDPSVLGDL